MAVTYRVTLELKVTEEQIISNITRSGDVEPHKLTDGFIDGIGDSIAEDMLFYVDTDGYVDWAIPNGDYDYDAVRAAFGITKEDPQDENVVRIHPDQGAMF